MSEFRFYMDVLRALEEIGARYMVVGAYGASAYGLSRSTHDVDIIVDLERIQEEIEEEGPLFEGHYWISTST